jgi:two-component system OmpR family response regulator
MQMFKWLFGSGNTGKKKKILVVDDEPNIVRTVADRLRMSGYDVITAADGEQAVAAAMKDRPNLILLDVIMPKLDGHGVLQRLRQMDETRQTPVIMLTARSQGQDVERATTAGVTDYIVKPFDLVEVLEKIKRELSRAGK